MNLLRIYVSLTDPASLCRWALVKDGLAPVTGEGGLGDLPRGAGRIQLVLPAAEVLLTRARVPRSARVGAESMLAFAVEDRTATDPDANQASWLGSLGDADVLAVVDRSALQRLLAACEAGGIRIDEVHCETLLLPLLAGEWSMAWNGREGFVRTAAFEGAATDCGDLRTPPMQLHVLLEEAKADGVPAIALALYPTSLAATPDIAAWQDSLGIPVRLAGIGNWQSAANASGIPLPQPQRRWQGLSGMATRLRPAAWILGIALLVHVGAMLFDWMALADEQRALRQQMEVRFRAAFPDAIAVTDPALQMRRKLADARHRAGLADDSDLMPMIEQLAEPTQGLPAGSLRTVSYESGRLTLEIAASAEAEATRFIRRMRESGMSVERQPPNASAAKPVIVLWLRRS